MGINRPMLHRGVAFTVSCSRRMAFTLLELLVGLAVLAVLVSILFSVLSNFSQVTSASTRRTEVSRQSRAMFDRLDFDLGAAVTSKGVRLGLYKNAALPGAAASKNDALVLLADAKTRDAFGRLAKIGYGVGPYTDQGRQMTTDTVLRYVQTFGWGDDVTTIAITDSVDAQPVAPGIVRFEMSFMKKDGSIVAEPPGETAPDEEVRAFHENLAGIYCTVATLDSDTLKKLSGQDVASIANRLSDAMNGETPLANWQAVQFTDLPSPVGQGLRFQQRYFRLQ